MNLSPEWAPFLHGHGFEAVHWSAVGAINAPDTQIMPWARDHARVVFTHDLDFGILLAHPKDRQPSVIQARVQDVSPESLGSFVVAALQTHGGVGAGSYSYDRRDQDQNSYPADLRVRPETPNKARQRTAWRPSLSLGRSVIPTEAEQ